MIAVLSQVCASKLFFSAQRGCYLLNTRGIGARRVRGDVDSAPVVRRGQTTWVIYDANQARLAQNLPDALIARQPGDIVNQLLFRSHVLLQASVLIRVDIGLLQQLLRGLPGGSWDRSNACRIRLEVSRSRACCWQWLIWSVARLASRRARWASTCCSSD